MTCFPCLVPVVERLRAGAALAPTLREREVPDGTRYAVLDFIIEVPVTEPIEWQQVRRVLLGWDWGVRTLVTATVLDLDGNRLAPPVPGQRRLRWNRDLHQAAY